MKTLSFANPVLLAVCSVFAPLGWGAGESANAVGGDPNLHFEEQVYDFRFAGQDREITHQFKFTNTGSGKLVIEAVRASCGCMVPVAARDAIAPGAGGVIEATCKTGKRIGRMTEIIKVQSNDPRKPQTEITITGIIKTEYALDPEFLYIGDVERGDPVWKSLRLIALDNTELVVPRVEVSEEYLVTEVSKLADGGLRGYVIQVALKPDAPPGRFAVPLTIHTNLPRHPRIDVPVAGNVLGRIRVRPSTLSFGELGRGLPPQERLTVTCADQHGFTISTVTMSPPVLQVESRRIENETGYEIRFRVDEPVHPGPFAAMLTIHTDDPNEPTVEVPVRGTILKAAEDANRPSSSRPGGAARPDSGHLYITRLPTEEDTYVAAWLIRRFLDPEAQFRFMPSDSPPSKDAGVLFDLPDSRARWRRTQTGCTSEHILAQMKDPAPALKTIVAYIRKLERASWLVSANSDAGRLHAWILKINSSIEQPELRVQKVFEYLDIVYAAGGTVPQ